MGKRIDPREKVSQRSISLKRRHTDFLDFLIHDDKASEDFKDFNIHQMVQNRLDEQIAEMIPRFLSENDERRLE